MRVEKISINICTPVAQNTHQCLARPSQMKTEQENKVGIAVAHASPQREWH